MNDQNMWGISTENLLDIHNSDGTATIISGKKVTTCLKFRVADGARHCTLSLLKSRCFPSPKGILLRIDYTVSHLSKLVVTCNDGESKQLCEFRMPLLPTDKSSQKSHDKVVMKCINIKIGYLIDAVILSPTASSVEVLKTSITDIDIPLDVAQSYGSEPILLELKEFNYDKWAELQVDSLCRYLYDLAKIIADINKLEAAVHFLEGCQLKACRTCQRQSHIDDWEDYVDDGIIPRIKYCAASNCGGAIFLNAFKTTVEEPNFQAAVWSRFDQFLSSTFDIERWMQRDREIEEKQEENQRRAEEQYYEIHCSYKYECPKCSNKEPYHLYKLRIAREKEAQDLLSSLQQHSDVHHSNSNYMAENESQEGEESCEDLSLSNNNNNSVAKIAYLQKPISFCSICHLPYAPPLLFYVEDFVSRNVSFMEEKKSKAERLRMEIAQAQERAKGKPPPMFKHCLGRWRMGEVWGDRGRGKREVLSTTLTDKGVFRMLFPLESKEVRRRDRRGMEKEKEREKMVKQRDEKRRKKEERRARHRAQEEERKKMSASSLFLTEEPPTYPPLLSRAPPLQSSSLPALLRDRVRGGTEDGREGSLFLEDSLELSYGQNQDDIKKKSDEEGERAREKSIIEVLSKSLSQQISLTSLPPLSSREVARQHSLPPLLFTPEKESEESRVVWVGGLAGLYPLHDHPLILPPKEEKTEGSSENREAEGGEEEEEEDMFTLHKIYPPFPAQVLVRVCCLHSTKMQLLKPFEPNELLTLRIHKTIPSRVREDRRVVGEDGGEGERELNSVTTIGGDSANIIGGAVVNNNSKTDIHTSAKDTEGSDSNVTVVLHDPSHPQHFFIGLRYFYTSCPLNQVQQGGGKREGKVGKGVNVGKSGREETASGKEGRSKASHETVKESRQKGRQGLVSNSTNATGTDFISSTSPFTVALPSVLRNCYKVQSFLRCEYLEIPALDNKSLNPMNNPSNVRTNPYAWKGAVPGERKEVFSIPLGAVYSVQIIPMDDVDLDSPHYRPPTISSTSISLLSPIGADLVYELVFPVQSLNSGGEVMYGSFAVYLSPPVPLFHLLPHLHDLIYIHPIHSKLFIQQLLEKNRGDRKTMRTTTELSELIGLIDEERIATFCKGEALVTKNINEVEFLCETGSV